ncbi:L,D-transpeptidase [Geobacter pickeringii]|uniref:ErfK/YbiS/YcfS/YnhG family protein n=1 Tax=Geobacter pickeringii TaxID=345632 RepID=A0A0B5B954_9BACT|nr:L,D-transpeptidase [Geobacter pickeringii]AJE03268.1 ErfK/YbiS/YcfS/YnhG family protein [Geobacter pickeringii]
MIRSLSPFIALIILAAIVVHEPLPTSEPGASLADKAKEDLSRIDYPSLRNIDWTPHFMQPSESLESLFGPDWVTVARFNRIDRRHTYPGMTIKVPVDMAAARSYTPLPREYEPAKHYEKYILISLTEQWIGAYENGKLKFSMPAATGSEGHETPTGVFRVDARHRTHTSSLYKTEDQTAQYPMDYAIRFHVGEDNVAYWMHARDLPGRPASHGCVGLYDEPMQKRMYGIPDRAVLHDSKKLYDWAVGENEYEDDAGELELLEDGPVVEVIGTNPVYRSAPLKPLVVSR